MVDPDTDDGGVLDGAEDFDKDGKYEPTAGEGNPLDPSDDTSIMICDEDHPDCGPANNGRVCDTSQSLCVDGCKKDDGSGCPDGKICIFPEADSEIGYCGNVDAGSGGGTITDILVQGGCLCEMRPGDGKIKLAWALLLALGAGFAVRRRSRTSR
jgi:MYXO-CTERM domain-containing protein